MNNPQDIDTDLMQKYIGKNYEKIMKQGFSVPAFFFGAFYAAYRKMFGFAILFTLVFSLIGTLFSSINPILIWIIEIVATLIYAFFANKLYIRHVQKKINKLMIKNPPNMSIDDVCIKKGGTSVGAIFGFIALLILIAIIISFIITALFGFSAYNTIKSTLDDETSTFTYDNTDNTYDDYTNTYDNSSYNTGNSEEFQGVFFYDTSCNLDEYLNIDVPSAFEETSFSSKSCYRYEYEEESSSGVFNNCEFELGIIEGYTDAEELLNQMAEYYEIENFVRTKKSNGITWNYLKSEESFEVTYYHTAQYNDKVFIFEYKIGEDVEDIDTAVKYYNDVFSSIKFIE